MARVSYVELPARAFAAAKDFYERAFDLDLMGIGPTYAATTSGGVDVGLQGDMAEATAAPLVIFETDDLEAQLERVLAAGGTVTRPIFAFPGGRRFHFRDPAGNELAAVKADG